MKMKLIRSILCLTLMVLIIMVFTSCNKNEDQTTMEMKKYIGQEIKEVEESIKDTYDNTEVIYEYSYITDKDHVINIVEQSDQRQQIYVSLGLPNEDVNISNGSSYIENYGGRIYVVNNANSCVINNGLCEIQKDFKEESKPYLFDIYDDYSYFRDETTGNLYKTSLKDDDIAIVTNDLIKKSDKLEVDIMTLTYTSGANIRNIFLVVNNHIYYKGVDERFYRITINGNEKTLLSSDEKVFNVKYAAGWVYFLDYDFKLHRIKTDGTKEEVIVNDVSVKNYEFDITSGKLIIQSDFDEFYVVADKNNKTKIEYSLTDLVRQKGLEEIRVNISGVFKDRLYLFIDATISDDEKQNIICVDIGNKGKEEIILTDYIDNINTYLPKLINHYIYYYDYNKEKLCRMNLVTMEIQSIGEYFNIEDVFA